MADAAPYGVLVAVCTSLLITTAAQAAPDCLALKGQRDQLARRAMTAEITLLHAFRQRLCPSDEERASQSNALASGTTAREPFNYEAYIRCREKAEIQLQHTRPVLYRNVRGFSFYTPEGSRLAREADGVQKLVDRTCTPPAS
jgi:hypothetical protein